MNELYHVHGFKYVKREWKNGKWNYYYDNGKGKQTSLGVANKISDWIGQDEKERARQAGERLGLAKFKSGLSREWLNDARTRAWRSSYKWQQDRANYSEASKQVEEVRNTNRRIAGFADLARRNPERAVEILTSPGGIKNADIMGYGDFAKGVNARLAYEDRQHGRHNTENQRRAASETLQGIRDSMMESAKNFVAANNALRITAKVMNATSNQVKADTRNVASALTANIVDAVKVADARSDYDSAVNEYNKTFLAKVEKGMAWVQNLFK